MPQLVNSACRICGERIASVLEGEFCTSCNSPIHHGCMHASSGVIDRCSTCGARLRVDNGDDISPHSQKTTPDWLLTIHAFFFSWRGRECRECFLAQRVLNLMLLAGLMIGAQPILEAFGRTGEPIIAMIILILAAYVWSEIAIRIRRLHDMDRPGWLVLLLFVPVCNMFLDGILLAVEGTIGTNSYGEDPLETGLDQNDLLLSSGFRHEMNGDWERALQFYAGASERLSGQVGCEYAVNCMKRVRQKMSRACQGV